jgi:hypothetical protein
VVAADVAVVYDVVLVQALRVVVQQAEQDLDVLPVRRALVLVGALRHDLARVEQRLLRGVSASGWRARFVKGNKQTLHQRN